MRPHRFIRAVSGILLLVLTSGCGSADGFTSAPVSGKITLNGVPLAGASVVFQPVATGNPGPPSSAETDDQGLFTLQFTNGNEGAVIGKHKVYISTRKMQPASENSDVEVEIAPELVPANYRTDPPNFDVPKEGTDNANFELAGTGPAGGDQGGQPTRVRND